MAKTKASKEVAIKVDHVYKNFVLPHERINTVKGLFTSVFNSRTAGAETQHALKDIDFEIRKGEFFGIVGRNGSGKSTLLKILAGIYQPSKGKVSTVGKLVPFIELGVGFNPELTGRENVFLNGAMLGFTRREITEMYDDIVSFAELEKFMDQKLKNYSSGMQVRLAFSMATRAEADILLVDEVLAVGDADFQRKCFSFFKELKRKKKTIVFVSHDMNSIREYCDRVLLIDKSEVVAQGDPVKVSAEYSKLFLDGAGQTSNDGNEDRWGNQTAYVRKPKAVVTSRTVSISFDIKAESLLDSPILGFVVSDESGKQICGSNTMMLGQKLPSFKPNSTTTYTFTLDNIFGDGVYAVTLAVLTDSGITTADWWVGATSFIVKKAQHTPYVVDVPVVFSQGKA